MSSKDRMRQDASQEHPLLSIGSSVDPPWLAADLQLNGTSESTTRAPGAHSTAAAARPAAELNPRGQWNSKLEFILACFGGCIGLGNMWRFPYLCYKNGGGAFLVPYFICLMLAGAPAVFLEIALGIGYGTTIVVFYLNCYYIIILAWALLYLAYSISFAGDVMPWTRCDQEWNSPGCTLNWTENASASLIGATTGNRSVGVARVDPMTDFWQHKVLRISDGIDDVGGLNWDLVICLLVVWIVCYLCVFKGVQWTGRVVYFTALFPYVLLFVLIVRGVTLPGAAQGLAYYIKPDFSRLAEPQVWIDAGTQIFFSYATSLGALTALGSYNKFNNNCYKDAMLLVCANSVTSMLSGIAVFSVLGFMAKQYGVLVADVADKGPGLAFIAYPKAISQLPGSSFWAILFFLMVIVLGLDSQFIEMEAFVTAVVDLFPRSLRRGCRKELFTLATAAVSFAIGLTMVTRGGMYVFQLFDYYAASGMALLWFCIFECIAIGWAYGAERFYVNVESMIGYRINAWMRWAWRYTAIAFCSFVLVFWLAYYETLRYNTTYIYPRWADAIGWTMAASSMCCVPLYAAYALYRSTFTHPRMSWRKRVQMLTRPRLHDDVSVMTLQQVLSDHSADLRLAHLELADNANGFT